MFIGKIFIAAAFVGDILFWPSDKHDINILGGELWNQGLLLEQDNDTTGFIEEAMVKTDDGKLEVN